MKKCVCGLIGKCHILTRKGETFMKGKNPFIFYGAVRQEIGSNVLEGLYNTDDYRLVGHVIPENVKDPKRYMEDLSNLLDIYEKQGQEAFCENHVESSVPIASRIVCADMESTTGGKMANFQLLPKLRVIYRNRKGAELPDEEKIWIEVRFDNGTAYSYEICAADICNLVKLVRKKFPEAIVDYDQSANAEKSIEKDFRSKIGEVPKRICLKEAGWQFVAGRMTYIHDGLSVPDGIIADTGLNLPKTEMNRQDYGMIYINSLNIYRKSPQMYVMSLFSFLGILYRTFRQAGYPPHFLLFMNGRTGSLKTSIAKILYTQLDNDKFRDHPRRLDADSITSFERGIVKSGYDTILLFDDYAPAKTFQKRKEMKEKLETIIRMIGDGSTKSRSNANLDDVRGEGVQGMVVVTGELKGKGASSNLRCLYVELEKEYANLEVISWFQENATAYTSMLNGFADFVGANWREIINFIKNEFPKERRELEKYLEERRSVDTAAVLRITAAILRKFLVEYCQIQGTDINRLCMEMRQSVIEISLQNVENSHDDSLGVIFIQAIYELMHTGRVHIHDKRPENFGEMESFDGFCDESAFYFYLPAIYGKILSYFRETNRYFPLDPDEMASELCQEGISVSGANGSSSNGQARRNKYWRVQIRGNNTKINFVKIRKSIFERIVNEASMKM